MVERLNTAAWFGLPTAVHHRATVIPWAPAEVILSEVFAGGAAAHVPGSLSAPGSCHTASFPADSMGLLVTEERLAFPFAHGRLRVYMEAFLKGT